MANVAKSRGKGPHLAHHHRVIMAAALGEVCFSRLCEPGPLYPSSILTFRHTGDQDRWHRICSTCVQIAEREGVLDV